MLYCLGKIDLFKYFSTKTCVLFFSLICLNSFEIKSLNAADEINQPTFCIHTRLKQTVGKGIDRLPSYTTLQTFLGKNSTKNDPFLPFLDLKLHYLHKNRLAGNFGTGIRYFVESFKKTVGLSVFYDFRKMHSCRFQQIGSSLEIFSTHYNFRINGYFPFGQKVDRYHFVNFTYSGGYKATCYERRSALYGGDMEVETKLNHWIKFLPFNLEMAWGVYYYHDPFATSKMAGNRIRLQLNYSPIQIGTTFYYDPIYHCQFQSFISINFLFGSQKSTDNLLSLNQWICQPVQRQENILRSRRCCSWKFNW